MNVKTGYRPSCLVPYGNYVEFDGSGISHNHGDIDEAIIWIDWGADANCYVLYKRNRKLEKEKPRGRTRD